MIKKKKRFTRLKKRFNPRNFDFRKGVALLPHMLTLMNIFLGFYSLVLAGRGTFRLASECILFASLMDMLDGRTARLVGVTSEFGVELDSLADALSFCIAPAFLLSYCFFTHNPWLGLCISFFYVGSGIIRLARFNIIHKSQTQFFLGLPTTIAGCFLATLTLNFLHLAQSAGLRLLISFITLVLSLLMVSSLPFPTFKYYNLARKKHLIAIMAIVLFLFIALFKIAVLLLIFFITYFIISLMMMIRHFRAKAHHGHKRHIPS